MRNDGAENEFETNLSLFSLRSVRMSKRGTVRY